MSDSEERYPDLSDEAEAVAEILELRSVSLDALDLEAGGLVPGSRGAMEIERRTANLLRARSILTRVRIAQLHELRASRRHAELMTALGTVARHLGEK